MPEGKRAPGLKCPSAQADMADAQVLGVVEHGDEGPRLSYLAAHQPATPEILEMTGTAPVLQVLRLAATCEEKRCTHFDGAHCGLVRRIVESLDPVADTLPPCAIRRDCRWYAEEGRPACLRCPQVVTEVNRTDERAGKYREIAGVPA